ncbi:MAG: hypothetical protein JXK07_11690 [Spirochaetes bacterium]|nr:hypothetical protein [Spirochaetota bacterium]MBN2769896.1 hypothetical protein [Spirochaetota bacterium]
MKNFIFTIIFILLFNLNSCESGTTSDKDKAPIETAPAATLCDGSSSDGSFSGDSPIMLPLPDYCGTTLTTGTKITFYSLGENIEISVIQDSEAAPEWKSADHFTFNTPGTFYLAARPSPDCQESDIYRRTYTVLDSFCGAAGESDSGAVHMDSSALTGWASGCKDYLPGEDVSDEWKDPSSATGKASGTISDIVSLGNNGSIVLTFDHSIKNGTGFDFAVFENSFSDYFLELAWVEVSSNGTDYVRFDSISLTREPVDGYGTLDPTLIHGLAGKYRQEYGTPFDLSELLYHRAVIDNRVDINAIRFIRIVDITGNGNDYDSFGNPIYDPYPTIGSVGFDLDAVGTTSRGR